ncbi:response regulator [Aestuariicella hydrocarbonica]|uniref:histidine kinase n=1 Tax=Pseudomaricurvus hydrocarbonicus TaxID=1470433 RepID=A0A9E5T3X2_9GAMM|nr:response regulator [Aestuariicella hydrocarbonica]NHO67533.1 response regulator [Aestuariicella hydrocarbonica]
MLRFTDCGRFTVRFPAGTIDALIRTLCLCGLALATVFPLQAHAASPLLQQITATHITAVLIGATAMLVLINLGQAWIRRETLNLWLAIYVLALSATFLCVWQINHTPPPATTAHIASRLFVLMAMVAQCRLVFRFAPLPKSAARWKTWFIGLSTGVVLLAATAASLMSPAATQFLKLMFLCSTLLCVIHLAILVHQQADNALLLLLAKGFALFAFAGTWLLNSLYTGQPGSHWLAQSTIIIESMFITYALVMVSVERWQRRLQAHYQRSRDLKLKQQYNATLKLVDQELRTPLSGIVGIAELLLDTSLTKTQRDQISTMRRVSESLLKWLNRLNDWRALQLGRLRFDAIPFDFSQVLQTLFEDSQVKARDRKIQLTYTPHDNPPTLVKGDPARLKQIISGTLELALFYSEQGEIHIELQPLPVRNRWQLVITDSQTGLQPEDIQISLGDDQEHDTGHYSSVQRNWLIAKALAEHTGGQLTVELEQGRARFSCEFLLPRYSLLQHHESQYDQLLHKKRLLVVDYSSSSRKVVAKRADSWGMKSTCVPNGKDALAIIDTMSQLGADFDAVILDHELPDMNGLDLARRIVQHPSVTQPPVILMLTGDNSFPAEDQVLDACIHSVLTKPISAQSLKITLAEELTLQQARQKTRPEPTLPDDTLI